VEKFKKLIEEATPAPDCEALWQLNEEVVFIKDLDLVLERATGKVIEPNKFMHHVYANRFYVERVVKGSGKNERITIDKVKLAPKWVEWEQRAELRELTYEPGAPKVIEGRAWNTWDGWGVKPKKGSMAPWIWLLDFLFYNDQKAKRYFEQWCAYPIQHPGAKMFVAVVLWSRIKRLGKGLLFTPLRQIYGENAALINSKQLKSNFNSWARNKQLVIGEEITAGEARIDAEYLKDIITSPIFTINAKFKEEYTIPNHTNFGFLSNQPDAISLEDGDKRYLIHGIWHQNPASRDKYRWYGAWLKNDGASYLMDYLLNLKLGSFDPMEHAPETTSKHEMNFVGKAGLAVWVLRLQEDPRTALKGLGAAPSEGCDLFTPEQLYRAFDPQDRRPGGGASLGRVLSSAGFRQVNGGIPVGTSSGIHRLYAVRNVVKWEQSSRKEIREHYEQFFGLKVTGGVK
jgi:hypothetical protein